MSETSEKDRSNARFLRLAVVTNLYRNGYISRSYADELLNGPLTPGDDTTFSDDRDLLEQDIDTIMRKLGITDVAR